MFVTDAGDPALFLNGVAAILFAEVMRGAEEFTQAIGSIEIGEAADDDLYLLAIFRNDRAGKREKRRIDFGDGDGRKMRVELGLEGPDGRFAIELAPQAVDARDANQ